MASTIQIKRGTGSAVPTGLADGELAINLDNNRLYFGSGSAVKNSFRVAELIADTATITQVTSSIVSSSVLFSSGSNIFGDALSDTHTFNGNVTASNDLTVANDLTVGGNINANGNIIGDDSTNITNIATIQSDNFAGDINGDHKLQITSDALDLRVDDTSILELKEGQSSFSTNVTASGNISSSGDVFATDLSLGGSSRISSTAGTVQILDHLDVANGMHITASGDISSSGNVIANQIRANGRVYTNYNLSNEHFIRNTSVNNPMVSAVGGFHTGGHITASGNISGSGTSLITAQDLTLDRQLTVPTIANVNTTHITASGDISSSGAIVADQFVIDNADNNGVSLNSSTNAQLDITAGAGGALNLVYFKSAEIEVSGDAKIDGSLIHRGDTDTKITFGTDQMDFVAGNVTMIALDETANGNSISLNAPITASGNISGSVTSTGSFGRVEASGVIKAEHIESTDDMTVAGDLDVTGEIECDHLNIADVDDGIHFGDTQVLFIDASNNVNFGVDGNAAVDLELYGHDHTYTAGGNITLDATGNITLDAASNYVRFKDSGTTTLTIDTSAGHITASGNISASAGSILNVPLRHLDQTVQNITGSRAQGDIFYAESNVSTVPGKIYAMLGNGNQTPADKDTELYASSLLGVAIGTNSGTDGYLLKGMVKLHTNPFPGEAAIGGPAYLGDDGLATGSIAGHASDDFIRIIGYGISGSGTIYFDPDKTFIKKS